MASDMLNPPGLDGVEVGSERVDGRVQTVGGTSQLKKLMAGLLSFS